MSKLVFLDLETTGLDPEVEAILELGVVIYDNITEEMIEKSWVFFYSQYELDVVDPYVVDMHTKNGLWEECHKSEYYINESYAEMECIEFLREHMGEENSPMCGNTIHFDRAFLKENMPTLEKWFHYRNLDVSTLNNIAQFFPDCLNAAPKGDAHRAIADCKSSIRQLNHYLNQMRYTGTDRK